MGHQPNNEQGDFRRGRLFWKPTLQNVLVATIFIHVSGPFFGEEHIYSNNSTLKMIPILWKIKSNDILQDLTLVELCAQRKRRGDNAAQGKCSNRTPRDLNPQKRKDFALHRSRPSSSLQSKGLWGWTSTSRLSTVLYKGKVICADVPL